MLSIRPGVPIAMIIDYLAHAVNDLMVIRNAPYVDQVDRYFAWVATQQRSLGTTISARDMDRLVTTRTYWALLGSAQDSALEPVRTEMDVRVMELEAELAALRLEASQHAIRGWTTLAVLDTNVLMERHQELQTMAWHEIVQERSMRNVHVLIPLSVVDELDRLKRSQGNMVAVSYTHLTLPTKRIV